MWGGCSIWFTVRDLGTYRTLTKICLHDCICLGGEDAGRGMEKKRLPMVLCVLLKISTENGNSD